MYNLSALSGSGVYSVPPNDPGLRVSLNSPLATLLCLVLLAHVLELTFRRTGGSTSMRELNRPEPPSIDSY